MASSFGLTAYGYATSFVELRPSLGTANTGTDAVWMAYPVLKASRTWGHNMHRAEKIKALIQVAGIITTIALTFIAPQAGSDGDRGFVLRGVYEPTRTTGGGRPTQAKDPPVRSGSGVPVALCVSLAIVGTAGVVLAKEKGRNGGSGGGASSSSSSSGSYAYHMYAGGSGGGGDAGPSRGGHRGHPNGGRGPPAQQSRPPGGGGQRQPPSRQTLALPRVQKLRERPLPEQKPEPLGRPPPPPPPPPPPSNTAPPGEDDDSPKPPEEYNISGALVFALVLGLIAKHYFPQQEKERDWPEIINTTDVDLSGSSEMMKEFIETAAQLNIKTDEFDVLELLRDGLAAQAVVLPSVLEDVSVGGTNASPLRSKVVPAGLSPLLAKVNVVPTRAPDPIAAPWWRRKRNIEDYWMIYRLGCALLFALLERVRVPKVKLRSAFRTAEAAAADQTRRVGLDFDKMCAVYDQEVPPLVFMESAGFFLEPLLNSYSFRMKGKPRCSGLYKDSVWVKTTTDWVWDYHPFFNVGSDNFDAREVQWNEWTEVRYFEPVKEVEKGEHMEIIKVRPPWLRSSVHASPSAYPSGSGHGHGHGSPSGPGPGPPSSSYNAATSLSSPLSAPSTPERSPSRPLRPRPRDSPYPKAPRILYTIQEDPPDPPVPQASGLGSKGPPGGALTHLEVPLPPEVVDALAYRAKKMRESGDWHPTQGTAL